MKNKGIVKVATIQPPIPEGEKGGKVSHQEMVEKGLYFLEKAGRKKVDAVCLPEVFNIFGLPEEESIKKVSQPDKIRKKIMRLSASFKMYTIYTCFEKRGDKFYISSYLIDRNGKIVGRYDKTHPTRSEKEKLKVSPGNKYAVFKTDFGTVGIMICYDCYFPEVASVVFHFYNALFKTA